MANPIPLLIDEYGKLHPADSVELHRQLGVGANTGVAALAIQNLGYVGFGIGPRGARIWLSPLHAKPRAILAAREQLRRQKPARTLLTMQDRNENPSRLIVGWQEASMAIALAVSEARFKRPDAFLSELKHDAALAKFPALQELHRLWATTAGSDFLAAAYSVFEASPQLRCVLVDCDLTTGTSLINRMSGAFTAFEDSWLGMARGLRIQDQADYSYGVWIAETYARAAASGVPRIDDVDVEVARPGTGLIRSRYRRLLLPLATRRSDHLMLLSANILDRTIDLRAVQAS
jgi:hypothetical protein